MNTLGSAMKKMRQFTNFSAIREKYFHESYQGTTIIITNKYITFIAIPFTPKSSVN